MIVEDEPFARDVLQDYMDDSPDLELVKVCENAKTAREYLKENEIDLLFLDVNMPEISGITFLKSLSNAPLTIFTTAYPEFAIEGFELNAIDYLLKPFSFERFRTAVEKAVEKTGIAVSDNSSKAFLTLNVDKKLHRIEKETIHYLEGCGDYVKVYYQETSLLVHDTMRNLFERLPENRFMRIHKSYIVNLDRITVVEGNQVKINEQMIPIGVSYKDELMGKIQ